MKPWHPGSPFLRLLVAGTAAAIPAAHAPAQKPVAKPAEVYDVYEPSYRQRLRRESCARDEEAWGPNCVKNCAPGYVLEGAHTAPRCRSLKPLAPGQKPGPLQRHAVPHLKPIGPPPTPGKGPNS